jgi:BASS family bile acid:Na+ symporter
MPLVAFLLAEAFAFSPAKSIGLLLCGAVPGGSTSNLFTYYIGGDVGLSIFMTVTSVLMAIFMLPILLLIYGPLLLDDDDDVKFEVPYINIVATLFLVLIPTLGGIYLRSKSEHRAKQAENISSAIGVLFIAIALVSGLLDNLALLDSDAQTWVASAALSVVGFASGFGVSEASGLSRTTSLTIGFEVGVQNTVLSIAVAYVTFADAPTRQLNEALVFPLMCSLWDVANSIILLVAVKSKVFGELEKSPGTSLTTGDSSEEEKPHNEQEAAAGGGAGVSLIHTQIEMHEK